MSVIFSVESISFSLKEKSKIKKWIKEIIHLEKKEVGNISYIFCSDDYLIEVNKKYLNHDTYTDIITFDYTEHSNLVSGDIFISVERVKENASIFNVSFEDELKRVLIHGIFHLVGYSDKTVKDKTVMREKENGAISHFYGI